MKATTGKQILNTIQELELAGNTICLHASLKSFGHLEGGADTLIRAFLDSGCTLLVPTFTYDCRVPAPEEKRYPQNGTNYPYKPELIEAYNRNSAMISKDMGAVPARILEMGTHQRGIHPQNSFAAIGPLTNELIEAQTYLNVYGPFKKMYTLPRTNILLAGVDLTKATAIHFCEEKAGRRLFRQWARELDGSDREITVGSCSAGFNRFDPFVKDIEKNIPVGRSRWRIYPFRAFIDRVTNAIREDQEITHCGNPECLRCNDAVRGGPIL